MTHRMRDTLDYTLSNCFAALSSEKKMKKGTSHINSTTYPFTGKLTHTRTPKRQTHP